MQYFVLLALVFHWQSKHFESLFYLAVCYASSLRDVQLLLIALISVFISRDHSGLGQVPKGLLEKNLWGLLMQDFYNPVIQPALSKHWSDCLCDVHML